MTPAPNRFLRAVQRLALLSAQGPFVRLWEGTYGLLARAVAIQLTRGERYTAVYTRAGLAGGDLLPGVSDLDLVVVLPPDPAGRGTAAERVRRRYFALVRRIPVSARLVDVPCVYDDHELREVAGASYATCGLDQPEAPAVYRDDASLLDRRRILERPGLYGDLGDWHLLSGPERRPALAARSEDDRCVAAWLDLTFWWRFTFEACLDPARLYTPSLAVKLVAEPARIWLWLAHSEAPQTRRDVLARTQQLLPEEEESIGVALDLQSRLHRAPAPRLHDALPALARFSTRISTLVTSATTASGAHEVRLLGAEDAELLPARPLTGPPSGPHLHPAGAVPLCDWRSLAIPTHADESFTLAPDDPGDPSAVVQAAACRSGGAYRVLSRNGLLVFPTPALERPLPRLAACPASDPVSFALAAGRRTASFPEAHGWSIADTARRAVAEQRWRVAASPRQGFDHVAQTAGLLAATRAALVLESCQEGDPVIPVTLTATADLLGTRSSAARAVADGALAVLRDVTGRPPSASAPTVEGLRRLVADLPAYCRASS